jgi:acetoacetate decarboxylase
MDEHPARHSWSMPWDSPLVPPFPMGFRDVKVVTLVWRTTPEAVRAVLPPPLEPTSDYVLAHIYDMGDVDWLGAYGECNVMVGARLPAAASRPEVVGAYSPHLFLSSDIGLAHGREVHGQPKKFALPRLEVRDGLLVGTVVRNGIEIITGTMGYKQERSDLAQLQAIMPYAINLNYKVIPHIDGRPAIRQLTSRRLADVKVHGCWTGPCTVELRPNAAAPVHRLPVVQECHGFFWHADFTLVEGQVIYDYLAQAD